MNLSGRLCQFKHKFFQWKKDDDGELSLVVGGMVALTKHKWSTIISFPWSECWPRKEASRWQGYDGWMSDSG